MLASDVDLAELLLNYRLQMRVSGRNWTPANANKIRENRSVRIGQVESANRRLQTLVRPFQRVVFVSMRGFVFDRIFACRKPHVNFRVTGPAATIAVTQLGAYND